MKRSKLRLAVFSTAFLASLSVFCAQSSEATVLTFHYYGHVTSITDDSSGDGFGGTIHVGDRVNAFVTLTANLPVPDGNPDPNVGDFRPQDTDSNFDFRFSMPDREFDSGAFFLLYGDVEITNNVLPGDSIRLVSDYGDEAVFFLSFRDP